MPCRHAIRATVVAALALVVVACGVDPGVETLGSRSTPARADEHASDEAASTDDPRNDETSSDDTNTDDTNTDDTSDETPDRGLELLTSIPIEDVVDVGADKPARDHDDFVAVAIVDIERWWTEVFPTVYESEFVPLSDAVYAGYPERTDAIPGCGEPTTDYRDLEQYVAFYCQYDDFMVYDDGPRSLLTDLSDELGPSVMGIVLAHEYGHLVQERIGVLDESVPTIYTEQQADCFAGAWASQAYRGESPLLRIGDEEVRAGLIAMLSVRDPKGTDQFSAGGHGSAFDRVGAFQEGFLDGPARCAELIDEPLTLVPNVFRAENDLMLGGDAEYDCRNDPDPDCRPLYEFLADDLNDFWSTTIGSAMPTIDVEQVDDLDRIDCDDRSELAAEIVLCVSDATVYYDEPAVLDLYDAFGDFTLGYFYGIAWAELAQQIVGSELEGEARAMANDCLTGAWVRDITPDNTGRTPRMRDRDGDGVVDGVTSSPGDLDEAIRMAILEGDGNADDDIVGSAFEKIGAFRSGVLGGLDACDVTLP